MTVVTADAPASACATTYIQTLGDTCAVQRLDGSAAADLSSLAYPAAA